MDIYKSTRFTRPKPVDNASASTPNLYVANCGPAVGISLDDVESAFGAFGKVTAVIAADETGTRVIVCFSELEAAQEAFRVLNGHPCPALAGRTLHIRYSVRQPLHKIAGPSLPRVSLFSSELQIPGIYLVHEFISADEEKKLLEQVDIRPWKSLSKRRVQHYGYEFLYDTRNVDSKQFLGELPAFVSHILEKVASFPGIVDKKSKEIDQLTVNEYPCGVGLSPHIDTHSAFEECIFSLSTSSPCIMEFRRYPEATWCSPASASNNPSQPSNYIKKSIFLPRRSMLLMSGEGRYVWHHYIPHHKIDVIGGEVIRRNSRRVSFTFRKVRNGPCCCQYKEYCDSQRTIV